MTGDSDDDNMFINRQRCRWSFLRHHYTAAAPSSLFSSSSSAAPTVPINNVSLDFKYDNSVAILAINNSRKRNALTVPMMKEMEDHVALLRTWSSSSSSSDDANDDNSYDVDVLEETNSNVNNARAVIVTGSHGTFCSGLDLSDSNAGEDGGEEMLHRMTTITNQLLSLPVVTIAAVDGYAMGGGAELTTAADLVVLSHDAIIQFVHAKRGASTGWGGTRRLVTKVGRSRAIQLLLLGHCIRGDEEYARSISSSVGGGVEMIYADAVADRDETALDATIRLIIQPLLQLPCSNSLRAIKSAISAADGDRNVINKIDGTLNSSTNMAVKCEMESFMSVWGSQSNKEQIEKTKDRLVKKEGRRSSVVKKETLSE